MLKPQDVLVVLKLLAMKFRDAEFKWNFALLAEELNMSSSEVHAGYKRAVKAGLVNPQTKEPKFKAVEEFLSHGIQYVMPAEKSGITRGMPTAYAADVLKENFVVKDEFPPVWPMPEGKVKGIEFKPIYRSAPFAAKKDSVLYALLSLVDAIRGGKAREKIIAQKELKRFIGQAKHETN